MAAGDCERVPFRYEAQRATALRFGVRDLREDRWVTDWENHSFPTAKGIAEHRAEVLNRRCGWEQVAV